MKYLSMILAEKLLQVLDESGASEIQKLVALQVARAVVPVSTGSVCAIYEEELDSVKSNA